VVLAAYTAELTVYLNKPHGEVDSVTSVASLEASGRPVWTRELHRHMVEPFYPHLQYHLRPLEFDFVKALQDKDSHGVITGLATYKSWMTQTKNCGIRRVGNELTTKMAGWITNPQSPCVQRSIGYAIELQKVSGAVQFLINKWLPPATCTLVNPTLDGALSLTDLGGLMLLMGAVMGAALLVDLWKRNCGTCCVPARIMDTINDGDVIRMKPVGSPADPELSLSDVYCAVHELRLLVEESRIPSGERVLDVQCEGRSESDVDRVPTVECKDAVEFDVELVSVPTSPQSPSQPLLRAAPVQTNEEFRFEVGEMVVKV